MQNIFSLNKKVAFVLGGSGLIGLEVIKSLNFAGASVINLDLQNHSKKKSIKLANNKIIFQKFNCENNNLEKKIEMVFKKFGLPDIFINCSYPKTEDWKDNTFKHIKISSLKKNIQKHLISSVFLAKLVAEACLRKKKPCSVILLGSIYGLQGQDKSIYKGTNIRENMSYSIIKGGIVNFTKQMASYYAEHKIRINNICPGGVLDKTQLKNKLYKKFLRNYSNRVPIKRLAFPKEIAMPITFLASDAASYITGATLVVDGGWTII